ncbi:helicase-related protein, partial [Akkermansiaceae bacterium]|nr:helicase-related protein [Akkermansiaceae bacterium]
MPTSTQSIHEIAETRKTDLLLHLLETDPELKNVLVVLRTKDTLHALSTTLSYADIPASALHGGTKPELRDRAVRDLKEGHLRVLVALEAIARSIDLEGIRHVIQFNFHEITDDYLARVAAVKDANGSITTF